jgi:hypothetical protein
VLSRCLGARKYTLPCFFPAIFESLPGSVFLSFISAAEGGGNYLERYDFSDGIFRALVYARADYYILI